MSPMPLKDPIKRREYHNKYMREHYRKTPHYKEAHKKRVYRRNKRVRAAISELKKGPCTDCGHQFPPCAMDFDHVRGKKVAAISTLSTFSQKRIEAELQKCELVCAVCHRIRTFNRKNPNNRVAGLRESAGPHKAG